MPNTVPALEESEIISSLKDFEGFEYKDNKLYWKNKFQNFNQAFSFLTQLALFAETKDHHPEIFNVYNRVELALTTHDAGNKVSHKDIEFAAFVVKAAKNYT